MTAAVQKNFKPIAARFGASGDIVAVQRQAPMRGPSTGARGALFGTDDHGTMPGFDLLRRQVCRPMTGLIQAGPVVRWWVPGHS
ncbi:hypothetical protein OPV22_014550 [Ensete ventricosum]|uniref:Uncharacterized protein n=1 Tax=Ensete ventricosum TaxID=4639 RepID=A0AAV8PQF9_ENSVE|nr:hypothetical protein OPV22_014550 [Ensete ventricosum]